MLSFKTYGADYRDSILRDVRLETYSLFKQASYLSFLIITYVRSIVRQHHISLSWRNLIYIALKLTASTYISS